LRQCLLSPVEERMQRNRDVLETLMARGLMERLPDIELSDEEAQAIMEIIDKPRQYDISNTVLEAYEKWLYPEGIRGHWNREIEWHIWSGYLR